MSNQKIMLFNIETDIVDNCNIACAQCRHHAPYIPAGIYTLSEFEADIQKAFPAIMSKQFTIRGGEPLLHPDVFKFPEILKKYGFSNIFVLKTNGTLIKNFSKNDFKRYHKIHVEIFPTEDMENVKDIAIEYNNVCKNFEITISADLGLCNVYSQTENTELIDKIYSVCNARTHNNAIYKGMFLKCLKGYRKKDFLKNFGVDINNSDGYVNLDSQSLNSDIRNLLNRKITSCSYCCGTSGLLKPWYKQSDLDPHKDWITQQMVSI